jgi:imidazolonepropionase-like amidohydrolase
MRRNLILVIFVSTILVLCNACTKSKNPISTTHDVIVLHSAFLIDGTGSQPIQNAVVVIEDKHIKYVGIDSNYKKPNNAKIIDMFGYTILPGLINSHVHSGYSEANLKEWAKSGVTTVRDLGNFTQSPTAAFSFRNELLRENKNTHLVAAGPLVTTIGGYGNHEVSSPVDAHHKILGLIDAGADIIKIAIEDDLQGRRWPMLSMDEIKMIVHTAHENDILVSAHISRARHLEMAVKANVDDVAHMIVDELPVSIITNMIKKDIYWVPTLELWKGVSELHSLDWDTKAINNLNRFVRAGGKVALGTDYDGYVCEFDLGMPIHEIKLMVEAGMTPMEIIVAGTKHAAHVCNLENELGTIEEGKIANILIMKDNPLENIDAFTNVYMVIHNGSIIREGN